MGFFRLFTKLEDSLRGYVHGIARLELCRLSLSPCGTCVRCYRSSESQPRSVHPKLRCEWGGQIYTTGNSHKMA